MTKSEAEAVLRTIATQPSEKIVNALDVVLDGDQDAWFRKFPDLTVHPRDDVDESSLGIHQRWYCNVMPYTTLEYRGRKIFIFEHHLSDLLG